MNLYTQAFCKERNYFIKILNELLLKLLKLRSRKLRVVMDRNISLLVFIITFPLLMSVCVFVFLKNKMKKNDNMDTSDFTF
ncbi:MAG: hypothetical protein CL792_05775 [Chloroflexi bacterium]|nr:hypothetical protein [Chloroflexota bacterium]|tara:strand:+ start:1010 stop:1252 length:243 start_codon:yes stop_codon:yes gene_type:complete